MSNEIFSSFVQMVTQQNKQKVQRQQKIQAQIVTIYGGKYFNTAEAVSSTIIK